MYTFDEDMISDLHKDVCGFRPSAYWWTMWREASDLRRQEIWDDLLDDLRYEQEQRAKAQARAIESFEKLVSDTIQMGARDRESALRWILDAWNDRSIFPNDYEHFCYEHNLPYEMANQFHGIMKETTS